MACNAFSSVVVETCVDCWAADLAPPTVAELFEYVEYRLAMLVVCTPLSASLLDRAYLPLFYTVSSGRTIGYFWLERAQAVNTG